MNALAIIQALTGIAALAGQLTPLVLELKTALEANNDGAVQDLLKRLQTANDALGQA